MFLVTLHRVSLWSSFLFFLIVFHCGPVVFWLSIVFRDCICIRVCVRTSKSNG